MLPDETGCCQRDQVLPNVTRYYHIGMKWKEHFAYEATQLLTSPLQFMTCDHVLRITLCQTCFIIVTFPTHNTYAKDFSTCDIHNIMAIIILNWKDPARWHITNMTAHTSINIILPVRTRSWAFWAKLLTVKHPPQWLPGQTFYGILHRLVTTLITGPCSIVDSNAFACTKIDLLLKNFRP